MLTYWQEICNQNSAKTKERIKLCGDGRCDSSVPNEVQLRNELFDELKVVRITT